MSLQNEVAIRIPSALRPQTEGKATVTIVGTSVEDVLRILVEEFPQLQGKLFDAEGKLNRFINVYVNDEDIRFLSDLGTTLQPGDEVALVPAIAGG